MLMIFNIKDVIGVVLSAFVVNSKHISNIVLIVVFVKRLLGSYWKGKHCLRQDRAYHALCIILSVNKIY